MTIKSLKIVLCLFLTLCASLQARAAAVDPAAIAPVGERYEVTVPDTLDLAERGRLAVHGLTSFLNPVGAGGDPEAVMGPYGHAYFNANPAYMTDIPGGPPNWGKIAEGLILARRMSGSTENLETDARMLNGMLAWMRRPIAPPTPLSRAMIALMLVQEDSPNADLRGAIDEMAQRHVEQVKRDEGVYFHEQYDGNATALGVVGWGWMPFIQGTAIRALTRWGQVSGQPQYVSQSKELADTLLQPRFWAPEAAPKVVVPAEHGHFSGHHHSYTQGLLGLLAYAEASNNARVEAFVRDSYEYMRCYGIARIGLFGEGCTVGDMTKLAIGMSRAGIGDYWEDVDQYVRNHLVELQMTDRQALLEAVESMPAGRGMNDTVQGPFLPEQDSTENTIDRNIGVFFSDAAHPALIPEHNLLYTICCTGNCVPALYAAWEAIVTEDHGHAQVNLLLNRASPWLDVDSYLPFEGKVVVRNTSARVISIRLPRWVDKAAVQVDAPEHALPSSWLGRYLVLPETHRGDVITVTFPMVETTETYTLKWRQSEFWKESTDPGPNWQADESPLKYVFHLRGNTVVDIEPRPEGRGFPLYRREHLKTSTAPMKTVERFVRN